MVTCLRTPPSILALLVSLAVPYTAAAQDRVLYLASYGGSSEQIYRQRILPAFEAEHHVQVRYVAGTSAANLTRLQAQRGSPELDVAILDDGPMQQAVALGLCAPIAPTPILDDLYPIARLEGGRSVGLGLVTTGISYNTETFRKKGWAAPTSWRDLADTRYSGHLLIPSITNSYGLHALLMMARIEGGSERDINPRVRAHDASCAKRTFV